MGLLHVILVFEGLIIAAGGSAVLNDWRGAALAWDRFDERFSPAFRTPATFGGVALFALGATISLLPLLG